MDQVSLQLAAKELDAIATELIRAGDEGVRAFYVSVRPLVDLAQQGEIFEPMEWRDIPGGRCFLETDLHRHAVLENAFAKFRLAVTGHGL